MDYSYREGQLTANLSYKPLSISTDQQLGYQPSELFISSIVACSNILLGTILTKKRVSYTQLESNVSVLRAPDKANRIKQINILTKVDSNQKMNTIQSEKLARLVITNCGIIQSVNKSTDITLQIIFTKGNGDKS